MIATAETLGIPEVFNAADYFVDRNVRDGRGGSVAIECGEARVSYDQLLERTNRCGNALRDRLGVRREERVLLLLPDGPAFAFSFFGAMKIGAVPVPLNTLWKARDYQHVLSDSRARVLIVSDALLPQIFAIPAEARLHLRHIVVVGGRQQSTVDYEDLLDQAGPHLEAEPTSRDDSAFWLYSSGSTGVPKGCVHLHHDMVVCAELYGKGILGMTAHDRCFSVAKLFFAYGLGNALYMPFAVGATSILWPGAPTAPNVYAVIEQHRPTLFFSVPTNYGMLLSHHRDGGPEFDLSNLRHAVSAGEALPPAIFERFAQRFGITILDGIGSTEILHIFISNRPGATRPGSSGLVVPGYEARNVDDDNRPVPRGEIGSLLVSGDSTCSGYWNQHEKTKGTIDGRWIRTGDKYFQDEDGFFWYAARSDDMLKVGGVWVSPIEVENVLLEHEAVQECAVIGGEDQDRLIKPVAFVVLRNGIDGHAALAAELQHFVRERLAEYKRPRRVEFVAELPKTATGKIQRFRLRQQWQQP